MIISDSFIRSLKARDNEFQTCSGDQPVIVQFAANNATDLASAAELVANCSNGVDLNCGCPQKWAMHEGYGASLMEQPNLLKDMVLQTRNRISSDQFTVSAKIRIHSDIKKTVELCQQIEHTGLSFLTVHGRTKDQRSEPVDLTAIRTIKESVRIPVIANGDIMCLEDAESVHQSTGVNGVMAARGLLENPALFAGYNSTPLQCVRDWLKIGMETGINFITFHHHLMYMLNRQMSRSDRKLFNSLSSTAAVLDYLQEYLSYMDN